MAERPENAPSESPAGDAPAGELPPEFRPLDSRQLLYGLVGLALHVSLGLLVAASGLVAPGWAVTLLSLIWLALLAWGLATWRRSRMGAIRPPIVMGAVWIGLLTFGDVVLDWNA